MNEIVKYDNTLNTLQFKDFTAMDYNILMCLCHKVRDRGQDILHFKFSELKALAEYGNHSNELFAADLERMAAKLLKVNATHITGDKKSLFVLFPTFTIDSKKATLTVRVNKDFTFILNELTDNFTRFELKEFAELDSKYSKTLYRILKQYKYNGWWKPTVEELRLVLDVPANLETKFIMRDIIKPTLENLQDKFADLKCEPIRAKKRGAPVERYYFTFQAEKQIPGQQTIADYPGVLPGEKPTKKIPAKKPRKKSANAFNNFEQKEYTPQEMKELEKLLLDN